MAPKLSFITDEASQNPTEWIELAMTHGLESVELRTVLNRKVPSLGLDQQRGLSRQLRDAGLRVCCMDSDVFKCDLNHPVLSQIDELKRWCEASHNLGCARVRVFTFWRRSNPEKYASQIEDRLVAANEVAIAMGIQLLIENGRRTMHCTASELADLFVNLPTSMRIVWDPANSIFGGWTSDPLADFGRISSLVAHVHVKDPVYLSDSDRAYVEVGRGSLDIERQIKLLFDINFDDFVSLETHWRPGRVIDPSLLDNPGGDGFSLDGMAATETSLTYLANELKGLHYVS